MYQDDSSSHEYLSYEDLVTLSIKQTINGARKFRDLQNRINPGGSEFYPTIMNGSADINVTSSGSPLALHVVMFTHAIKSQGTRAI
ncbi:hypothetical protein DOY81_014179 [Sarcophaga bullata]|nr:hypothetical protein DOY81_014179 [Sarcophaga bullata]